MEAKDFPGLIFFCILDCNKNFTLAYFIWPSILALRHKVMMIWLLYFYSIKKLKELLMHLELSDTDSNQRLLSFMEVINTAWQFFINDF
tara:strand:+ start:623 stop:889 length:267 start_codon:yes stop_codon:yes gene_type:complete